MWNGMTSFLSVEDCSSAEVNALRCCIQGICKTVVVEELTQQLHHAHYVQHAPQFSPPFLININLNLVPGLPGLMLLYWW